jgi:hypothetical protein
VARAVVQISIDDRAAVQRMGDALERKLTAAILVVHARAVVRLSTGQPVRRLPSGRLIGLNPSRPGESPHVLYGQLRQSMTWVVERTGTKITAKTGSNLKKARALELGFVGRTRNGRMMNLAPRPYLRPSLAESWQQIRGIINS